MLLYQLRQLLCINWHGSGDAPNETHNNDPNKPIFFRMNYRNWQLTGIQRRAVITNWHQEVSLPTIWFLSPNLPSWARQSTPWIFLQPLIRAFPGNSARWSPSKGGAKLPERDGVDNPPVAF
jgi:hypothetical protein